MAESWDERAVICGLRAGRREAWCALYDHFLEPVRHYAAKLVGPGTPAADDVVQETFLAAARAAAQFDPERGALGAWLLGIVHRQAAQFWRREERAARRRQLAEKHAELGDWFDADEPPVLLERAEAVELVRGTLAELPAEYAALLAAKYVDELSVDEIVRRDGGTTEGVRSKLARARREFRARWEALVGGRVPQS